MAGVSRRSLPLPDLDGAAGQLQTGLLEGLVVEAIPPVAGAVLACFGITADGRPGHFLPREMILADEIFQLIARGAGPLARDPRDALAELGVGELLEAVAEESVSRSDRAGAALIVLQGVQDPADPVDRLGPRKVLCRESRLVLRIHVVMFERGRSAGLIQMNHFPLKGARPRASCARPRRSLGRRRGPRAGAVAL